MDKDYKNNENTLNWVKSRVPNISELIPVAVVSSFTNIWLEDWVKSLGSNSNNRSIIRDFIKIVPNIVSWYSGHNIGGTSIKYDEGNVYSSLFKPSCKAVMFASYEVSKNFVNYPVRDAHREIDPYLSSVATVGNYVCEVPSRVFSKFSQIRQKNNDTDIELTTYIYKNIDFSTMVPIVGEAITKQTIATMVGDVMNHIGFEKAISRMSNTVQSYVLTLTMGREIVFQEKSGFTERLNTILDIAQDFVSKPIFYISEYSLGFAKEMCRTYIFSFSVRLSQDTVGVNIENLLEHVGETKLPSALVDNEL